MLTVVCVWVRGPVPYTADYVIRLERMVRRYLARTFRFVCLTDRPEELPAGIETILVDAPAEAIPANGRGFWTKVQLFNPAIALTGRVLFLDLDTIVVAPLDPIVDFPAALALTEDALVAERAHLDRDRYGRQLVRRFNSSVMVWDAGTHDELFTRWSIAETARLSTDQDWIGEQAADAQALPLAWFPRISQVRPPWPADAIVVLCKKPKNHDAIVRWPELEPLWGGWAA